MKPILYLLTCTEAIHNQFDPVVWVKLVEPYAQRKYKYVRLID